MDTEKYSQQHPLFLGRPSRDIKLDELTLPECNQFWPAKAHLSRYEKLKVLSVTGGVPRYLELIDPNLSAEDNIRRLLFSRNSILLNEFNFIFSDTFGARSEIYRKIIVNLLKGSASLTELLTAGAKTKTGDYSEYLNDMVTAGFRARIDLAIQTRFNTFYLCEIKFSRIPLKPNIIPEVY